MTRRVSVFLRALLGPGSIVEDGIAIPTQFQEVPVVAGPLPPGPVEDSESPISEEEEDQ